MEFVHELFRIWIWDSKGSSNFLTVVLSIVNEYYQVVLLMKVAFIFVQSKKSARKRPLSSPDVNMKFCVYAFCFPKCWYGTSCLLVKSMRLDGRFRWMRFCFKSRVLASARPRSRLETAITSTWLCATRLSKIRSIPWWNKRQPQAHSSFFSWLVALYQSVDWSRTFGAVFHQCRSPAKSFGCHVADVVLQQLAHRTTVK